MQFSRIFPGHAPDHPRMVVSSALPIKLICDETLLLTSETFSVRHCVQYSTVLFRFALKLLVMFFGLFILLCFIYYLNKWFYTMIYQELCKHVNKLFFYCMERILISFTLFVMGKYYSVFQQPSAKSRV